MPGQPFQASGEAVHVLWMIGAEPQRCCVSAGDGAGAVGKAEHAPGLETGRRAGC